MIKSLSFCPSPSISIVIKKTLPVIAGSVFLAAMSQLQISLFSVPFSMQTLAVFLLALVCKRSTAFLSVITYLLYGISGIPVFAGLKGGLATLCGPTGGYLLGFLPAVAVISYIKEMNWQSTTARDVLAMLLGNGVIYLSGLFWLRNFIELEKALYFGLYIFIPGDLFKIALAVSILKGIQKVASCEKNKPKHNE